MPGLSPEDLLQIQFFDEGINCWLTVKLLYFREDQFSGIGVIATAEIGLDCKEFFGFVESYCAYYFSNAS